MLLSFSYKLQSLLSANGKNRFSHILFEANASPTKLFTMDRNTNVLSLGKRNNARMTFTLYNFHSIIDNFSQLAVHAVDHLPYQKYWLTVTVIPIPIFSYWAVWCSCFPLSKKKISYFPFARDHLTTYAHTLLCYVINTSLFFSTKYHLSNAIASKTNEVHFNAYILSIIYLN